VQVTRGSVSVNGEALDTSDGAAVEEVASLHIEAGADSEILLFDLD
jgi:redox-sensitive bicupin YhaK (pirin superfamily)